MRRLMLLRHAKSNWEDDTVSDHDRALNERGRDAAARMGAYMRDNGYLPAYVMCSGAKRTRETLDRLDLGDGCEIDYRESLYLANSAELLNAIRQVPNRYASLLVVAHNPGTEDLATGFGLSPEKYPTAAMGVFDFDGYWTQLPAVRVELVEFVVPSQLA